jgi:N-acetylglucosamine kinase-like BadF-type ATPase
MRYFLGVDIGGTSTRLMLMDSSGDAVLGGVERPAERPSAGD